MQLANTINTPIPNKTLIQFSTIPAIVGLSYIMYSYIMYSYIISWTDIIGVNQMQEVLIYF